MKIETKLTILEFFESTFSMEKLFFLKIFYEKFYKSLLIRLKN